MWKLCQILIGPEEIQQYEEVHLSSLESIGPLRLLILFLGPSHMSLHTILTKNPSSWPVKKLLNHLSNYTKKTEREMTRLFIYNFLEDMQNIKEFQEQEETPVLAPVDNLHKKKHENQMHPLRVAYDRVTSNYHWKIVLSIVHQSCSITQFHYQILCPLCMFPTIWCTNSP